MTGSPDQATQLVARLIGLGGVMGLISQIIDEAPANAKRDPEAAMWSRVSKCVEETGEVVAALIGALGQNPRKGVTHTMRDVKDELLDVVLTALTAYEHLDGNGGRSMADFADFVYDRRLQRCLDMAKGREPQWKQVDPSRPPLPESRPFPWADNKPWGEPPRAHGGTAAVKVSDFTDPSIQGKLADALEEDRDVGLREIADRVAKRPSEPGGFIHVGTEEVRVPVKPQELKGNRVEGVYEDPS